MDKNNTSRSLIFGAGDYTGMPQIGSLASNSLVIAADGGYKYLDSLGIAPDIYIGDYDSSECPEGVDAVRLPVEKDDTDMLAAVRLALGRGCREIHMFGGTGGRLDHTLANIQTLHFVTGRGGCGAAIAVVMAAISGCCAAKSISAAAASHSGAQSNGRDSISGW